jgi:amidase
VGDELAFATALELAAKIRAREVSPLELADLYLERIERLDPQLNAFVTVDAEGARAAARAAESAPAVAPFHGVPIPIKDLNEVAGLRTTFSTKALADYVPDFDVAVVRRLRDAGFVFLGKTNTPELGTIAQTESELNGACRNPWNTGLTPGGSSGGAAAAVAAGLAPAAHGSDGGGSIRIPASCCGLVGLKPSRGRVSPSPYGSGSLGLSTNGALARSVRDAAALLDVMAGPEPGDFFFAPEPERAFLAEVDEPPGRLRIAVTTTPPLQVPLDPECVAAVEGTAVLLAELGHDVLEATPQWQADEAIAEFIRVWQVGPALAGIDDLSLLEPINRALAEDARAASSPELGFAIIRLQALVRRIAAFWLDVDVLVTPTLALLPVPIGWTYEETDGDAHLAFARQLLFTPFAALFNVTGQPALSLPLHWSAEEIPVGVQLVGRPFAEATLIRLAAQLEQARPWRERRPPVS